MKSQTATLGERGPVFIYIFLLRYEQDVEMLWLGCVDSLLQPASNTWYQIKLSRLRDLEQSMAVGLAFKHACHATLSFYLAATFSEADK